MTLVFECLGKLYTDDEATTEAPYFYFSALVVDLQEQVEMRTTPGVSLEILLMHSENKQLIVYNVLKWALI